MKIFDSHAHYDDEKFDLDRDEIIQQIHKLGVEKIISAGYSLDGSKKAIELADLSGAKREINRIVSGYESEYIYLGKDIDNLKSIKSQYEAVYYALSNPVISLDSISLMFLSRR